MTAPAIAYSDDQAQAHDRIAEALRGIGVDIDDETTTPMAEGKTRVMAVVGKAGSGKTLLLAELVRALQGAGADVISGDWEGRRRKDRRTVAVLAPTNKAAKRPAHPRRARHHDPPHLYTPVYDPEFEKVAEWLAGNGERPEIEALTDAAMDRAKAVYEVHKSVPAALASAGVARLGFHHRLETARRPARQSGWSMNPRCWTTASSTTCARSFPSSCSSVTPPSWPR